MDIKFLDLVMGKLRSTIPLLGDRSLHLRSIDREIQEIFEKVQKSPLSKNEIEGLQNRVGDILKEVPKSMPRLLARLFPHQTMLSLNVLGKAEKLQSILDTGTSRPSFIITDQQLRSVERKLEKAVRSFSKIAIAGKNPLASSVEINNLRVALESARFVMAHAKPNQKISLLQSLVKKVEGDCVSMAYDAMLYEDLNSIPEELKLILNLSQEILEKNPTLELDGWDLDNLLFILTTLHKMDDRLSKDGPVAFDEIYATHGEVLSVLKDLKEEVLDQSEGIFKKIAQDVRESSKLLLDKINLTFPKEAALSRELRSIKAHSKTGTQDSQTLMNRLNQACLDPGLKKSRAYQMLLMQISNKIDKQI